MAKRKQPKRMMRSAPAKFMKSGLGLYGGAMAMGALPSLGNASAESIKGNVTGGMATFSGAYPAVGSMLGAGMVIGAAKNLTRTTKKIGGKVRRRR